MNGNRPALVVSMGKLKGESILEEEVPIQKGRFMEIVHNIAVAGLLLGAR